MYVLYKFDVVGMGDVSAVACADSFEKLVAGYELMTKESVQVAYQKAAGDRAARWIIQGTPYEIQKVKDW